MKERFAMMLFWLLLLLPLWAFIVMFLFEFSNGKIDLMNYRVILVCFLVMPLSAIYFIRRKSIYGKIYGGSIILYIVYQVYILLTEVNGAL